MKYAKLINNFPAYAPNPIHIGNRWRINPPDSVYGAEGYKPVIYTDPPQTESGYVAVPGWEETAEEIVQTWTVEEQPITEDDALVRYANELTGAEDETLEEATETLIKHFKEDE